MRPGPGRKQDQQLTQRVIEAAGANLAERGFQRLTLEGIARRAGVSRTAIYKRWSSLADLLLDVAVDAMQRLDPESAQPMQQPHSGNLADDLLAYFSQGMRRLDLLDSVGVTRPLLAESMLDPTLAGRVRTALFARDEDVFRAIVREAVERQEIEDPGPDAEHDFQALVGYGIFRAYLSHTPLTPAGLRHVADTLAYGMARRPPHRGAARESAP